MPSRWLAIMLLILLAVLPAAGEVWAFGSVEHCDPAPQSMAMTHGHEHVSVEQDCHNGSTHRQLPCAMMGLCAMTGCMALTSISAPEFQSAGQRVAFRVTGGLHLEGLALAPPLEPPRG